MNKFSPGQDVTLQLSPKTTATLSIAVTTGYPAKMNHNSIQRKMK